MLRKTYFLLLLTLVGCKHGQDVEIPFLPGFGPYKVNIQQGNVVTKAMVEKLRAGMTRSQVRFILGSPLVVDVFRNDRWDYVYEMNLRGSLTERRQLKVYFKDDKLDRYEGDLPLEKPAKDATGQQIANPAPKLVAPPPAAERRRPAQVPPSAQTTTPVAPPAMGDSQLRLAPTEGTPAAADPAAAAAKSATDKP